MTTTLYSSFIDGRRSTDAQSEGVQPLENPATREPIGEVELSSAKQVDAAVASAKAAHRTWWSLGSKRRAQLMVQWARSIREHAEETANLDVISAGRLKSEAIGDVLRSAPELEYWAYVGPEHYRAAERTHIPDTLNLTRAEPVGVAGLLLPGNVPSRMFLVHCAVALGLGNAVVAKPAEISPLSALRMAELATEAGIPSGVVNVVSGGAPVGAALVDHPDVGGLSFTGSTGTGRHVAVGAARRFVKAALELGGKSPQIVFADAPIEVACEAIVWSFCSNAGQVCTAGTRALVHQSIYRDVVHRLAQLAGRVVVGDPSRPEVHVGPLSSRRQFEKVLDAVAAGKAEARLACGGEPATEAGSGYYLQPTIFADVRPDARIFQEEIFGPVLAVTSFGSPEEAVELANNSMYGLAANIWTSDVRLAMRVAEQLAVGTVWVGSSRIGDPHMPLRAGSKSGGSHHRGLVDVFSRDKTIAMPTGADDFGASWNLRIR